MRNFTDYIERTKNEVEGEDYTDVLFEGFKEDLMRTENIDSVKSFIIGFLGGSGVDLRANKTHIQKLLNKPEISNVGEILKEMTIPDKKDSNLMKRSLLKSLTQLRPIIKTEEKTEEKME
jgi:hypothetical protein